MTVSPTLYPVKSPSYAVQISTTPCDAHPSEASRAVKGIPFSVPEWGGTGLRGQWWLLFLLIWPLVLQAPVDCRAHQSSGWFC
ncbi:UNVERIFIED_CONTAM: hypothetical protein FKN15_040683 [Acipenser sinensis]